MNNKITDVIIHTKDVLDDSNFARLVKKVYGNDGIVSMTRNVHTPRFLMVVYDAAQTKSLQILNVVKNQGIEASLVGM